MLRKQRDNWGDKRKFACLSRYVVPYFTMWDIFGGWGLCDVFRASRNYISTFVGYLSVSLGIWGVGVEAWHNWMCCFRLKLN